MAITPCGGSLGARKGLGARVIGLWLERALLLIGTLALVLWGATALDAARFQSEAGRRLDALLARVSPFDGSATAERTRAEVGASGIVGRIRIPSARIAAVVAEGLEARTLMRAVGHVAGSAFPGEHGNVALAGHRDQHFRGLGRVRQGDTIHVETPDGAFRYRVDRTLVVPPSRVDLIAPTRTPSLTLVTCYPFEALGNAPARFVVRARQLARAVE